MTDTLDKYFHDPQEEPEQKKELLIYDEYGWYISSYYFPCRWRLDSFGIEARYCGMDISERHY